MTLSVQEFNQKLTLRVLLGKIARGNSHPSYAELYSNAFYAINEILREEGLGDSAWAIRRGRRLYLLHKDTKRIICEVGIICEPYVEFCLITLRGIIPATETLQGLIQATSIRGVRRYALTYKERNKNE